METIIKAILLSTLISLVALLERSLLRTDYKFLLRPLLVASLGGLLLGNLTLGISVGLLVELIWGTNLFELNFGLRYINLAAILAVVLIVLTANISFVFAFTLALLITYVVQELLVGLAGGFERWLGELLAFLFFLTLVFFAPILKELLGLIPAQFLEALSITRGLLPALGLAVLLVRSILSEHHLEEQHLAYFLALLIALLFNLIDPWLSVLIFFIFWAGFYRLIELELFSEQQLRMTVVFLVVFSAPLLIDISGPLITSQLRLILWAQALLSLAALALLKLSQFELYFLFLLLGIFLTRWGILV